MAELKDWQKNELLTRLRLVVPDAEYAPEESYGEPCDVRFEDTCGCYSEWTQESCSLSVYVKGTFTGDGYSQARDMENCLEKWATGTLDWCGCCCCGSYLSVNVSLFPKKVAAV